MTIKKTTIILSALFALTGFSFAAQNAPSSNTEQSAPSNSANTPAKVQSAKNTQNPIEMLNNSIVNTQNLLVKDSEKLSDNPEALIRIINNNIMPILATNIIAQLLVGQTVWKEASKKDKKEFIASITHMLVYTYAKNVAQAGNYKITINPFDNDSWKKQRVIVATGRITNLQKNSSSEMSIYLLKNNKKQWRVYDLSVAGVSILDNLKAQFKQYKTLKEINTAIESKNVKLDNKKA
ncbi:MlaC/ttg2D family ABC transporter substrate-binding protein [Fangia hongkongensis]|uniref:MlaC/ttg2D family ABC transporter substrate-binding protein n=1 Tax=Fangia hongkongensis TaxID=270495 RepID=UPI00036CB858|nr:ABC transporter substrate-binding protein [Fangia hongkongensis]MBK2125340.1 ABC transporter substrate-binding protein [Fangia hongkongensis]